MVGYDLGYLRAGVDQLEQYLLSTEVYWPTGVKSPAGQPPYPQITLGGLLLARRRLRTLLSTPEPQTSLQKLESELDAQKTRWRVAWEKKAAREFHARLTLWRDFLEEVREEPKNNADRYPYEVTRRVMLDLLQAETGEIPAAEAELLTALDRLLRALLKPGAFVWESELQSEFPATRFWYLYGRLRE